MESKHTCGWLEPAYCEASDVAGILGVLLRGRKPDEASALAMVSETATEAVLLPDAFRCCRKPLTISLTV